FVFRKILNRHPAAKFNITLGETVECVHSAGVLHQRFAHQLHSAVKNHLAVKVMHATAL
ncbi:hypothetical protein HYU12_04655, partial [Candidatus Woesearchaeota archaeon]|nr:hypothetical protein [Candidatus Woesearchaeota archaeon]